MDSTHSPLLLALFNRLLSLKLLPRAGWLQRGVASAESVAEHTFGVAALALLVGDIEPDIDRGRVLAIALLHDMAEALLGDLPATARRLVGADVKRRAEGLALEELLAGLPQAGDYRALWEEYAQGSSREARLVKALDRVEMLAQALAYERAGNRALGEFWDDAEQGWSEEFPAVRALAQQLVDERQALLATKS
ncbi:MAG: HD family hydrolase [Chloroflexales bacterium]|nr:HD family hydrolase [Chloroflexales bacterium]